MSETRTHLKALATDQIRHANLAAASFRELGKAAGIKSSSVHYHFQSRDKLLTELLQDYNTDFFDRLDLMTEGMTKPRQRLLALFSIFEDSHKHQLQCMSLAYAASQHELSPASLEAVDHFLSRLEEWVTNTLANARLLPMPREQLARVLVSSLEGSLLFDRLHSEPRHLQATKDWICTLSSL